MGDWRFKVFQEGMEVAAGSGPTEESVRREATHYGVMYAQDGPSVMVKILPPRKPRKLPFPPPQAGG